MHEGHARRSAAPLAASLVAALMLAPAALAAPNECLVAFGGVPDAAADGGTFACDDCDPACDADDVSTPNRACTFNVQVCQNRSGEGCAAADIKKVRIKRSPGCRVKVRDMRVPGGPSSQCGAFTGVTVKTKKRGRKPGRCKLVVVAKTKTRPRQTDRDVLTLVCNPQQATECPTTTTTTTSSSTTTTLAACGDGIVSGVEQCDDGNLVDNDGCDSNCTLPACGNGIVNPGEECDPPCGAGCAEGSICNSECQCVAASACSCGTPDPARLSFKTTTPLIGDCGLLERVDGPDVPLVCGGLYFGGGGDAVPLPAAVPDLGNSLTRTCCSADQLTLAATTQAETGSRLTCTSAGCLFGAPLPIPNRAEAAVALSTCVINIVAQNAVGTADCSTGESQLSLPLTSEVYLYGDLLNGSADDRPDIPGIQPCPICTEGTCKGGPNHGLPCTPGSSVLKVCDGGPDRDKGCTQDNECPDSTCGTARSPYPTSHDCPPLRTPGPGQPIGALPIGFALTTGTASRTVVASGSQQHVFCGFCRDVDGTFCFAGDPGSGCPPSSGLQPCASDADCGQPFEACEQKNNGAFMFGGATTLTEMGSPAAGGFQTGDPPKASTLSSVFCIPPTFNAAIDASADLPGPGAVSLPGEVQLLP